MLELLLYMLDQLKSEYFVHRRQVLAYRPPIRQKQHSGLSLRGVGVSPSYSAQANVPVRCNRRKNMKHL
jgi:hypothetical protein